MNTKDNMVEFVELQGKDWKEYLKDQIDSWPDWKKDCICDEQKTKGKHSVGSNICCSEHEISNDDWYDYIQRQIDSWPDWKKDGLR